MEDKYNKVIDLLTDLLLQDRKIQDILMKADFYNKDDDYNICWAMECYADTTGIEKDLLDTLKEKWVQEEYDYGR